LSSVRNEQFEFEYGKMEKQLVELGTTAVPNKMKRLLDG
jgi:hypothetical protein